MSKITHGCCNYLLYVFVFIVCLFVCPSQIIDEEETQFMTNCPPAVTESTPRRHTTVQVYWTAPPTGSGCVLLKYVCSD